MGCAAVIAAVILFSAGIDRLDKNPVLAFILIGLSIAIGAVLYFTQDDLE